MSLLTKASLVMTPNAIKESKVYSIIPSSGNGDFTFTRGTLASSTLNNDAGLIETVPYNLVTYSQDYTNAAWGKVNSSITANSTQSPNGTNTASSLIENTVNNVHYLQRASAVFFNANADYTFSIYAKPNGRNWIALQITGFGSVYFNISTGTIGTVSVAAITPSIQSVGNGWYRCSMKTNITVDNANLQVFLAIGDTIGSYTGDGVSGVFLWGAQFVQGSSPKDYFFTTDRLNVPRLNYDTVGGCPSLLLEPQRINILTYSEQLDNIAGWTGTAINITANSIISPSGVQNADKIIPNTTNYFHYLSKNMITVTNGIQYSFSIFAKAAGYNYLLINTTTGTSSGIAGPLIDLSNGTVIGTYGGNNYSAKVTVFPDNWYRIDLLLTTNAILLSLDFNVFPTSTIATFSGNGSSGIYLWGAQLEAGAYPTSYIPTVASTVTRNGDVSNKSGISDLIGQTEGTIYIEYAPLTLSIIAGSNIISIKSTDNTNSVTLFLDVYADFPHFTIAIFKNSVGNYYSPFVSIPNLNFRKLAFVYKSNSISLFENGIRTYNNNATGIIFPFSSNFANLFLADVNPQGAKIKNVQIYKTALSDTECAALTTL